MRKWKARIREARVDRKTHGSRREREISTQVDATLGRWDPKAGRCRKFLPLDVIVLGYEPSTSSLVRRLKVATEEGTTELVETGEQSSSLSFGHDFQKPVSELEKPTSEDHEGLWETTRG